MVFSMHAAPRWKHTLRYVGALPLLLAITGLAANPVGGQEDAKGGNGRILFVSDRESADAFAVYAMNTDGSSPKRLSNEPGMALDPAWSWDHRQIVFSCIPHRGIPVSYLMVMNADGSEPILLVAGQEKTLFLSPAWSPDGKQIAYTALLLADGKLDAAIYVVDSDGKNRKKIGDGVLPIWSPDSKQILFSQLPEARGPRELKIMDADGGNVKTLKAKGLGASWSPDGRHIAFNGEGDGRPNLFVMDADGANLTQVTKDPDTIAVGPVWTPDSKHLLFTRLPKDHPEPGKGQICLMDADGSNVKAVTKEDSFLGPGVSLAFLLRSAGH